jgi:hypothetical protein
MLWFFVPELLPDGVSGRNDRPELDKGIVRDDQMVVFAHGIESTMSFLSFGGHYSSASVPVLMARSINPKD